MNQMSAKPRTRRKFISDIVRVIEPAGIVIGLTALSACRDRDSPGQDLSYRVLEAYENSDGRHVLVKRGKQFYKIIIGKYSSDEKPRVWHVEVINEEPSSVWGYSNSYSTLHPFDPCSFLCTIGVELDYKDKISSGIRFTDFRPLKPRFELAKSAYNRKYSVHMLQFVTKYYGDSSIEAEEAMRIKHAVGLNPRQHMAFFLPLREMTFPSIYDENTGISFCEVDVNGKSVTKEQYEKSHRLILESLPEILEKLNIKGTVVVPLDVFREQQIPNNYKVAFKNLHSAGDKYKVIVFER